MELLECDVLVVGGGPSGATAARDLAKKNLKVILLEKDNAFEKPCGGGLMLSAYEEFNIPESVIKKEVKTIGVVSPEKNRVDVDISEHPLTVVHRCEFDARLRQLAVEGGTQMIEAKAFEIQLGENITVWAKNKEESYKIEAKQVIAADGVNSLMRKKVLQETPSRVLTYHLDVENQTTESCQFWFGDDISPGHYSWIFPHHNGVNVGVIVNDEKKIKEHFENFRQKAEIQSENKPKGYYIPLWENKVYYEQGVYFVGDSASAVLPFTYEGIYYAMKSGRMAAEAIVKGDPSLYQKRWEAQYNRKFRFLKILQTLFLRNDYFAEKMVKLFEKPSFQNSVIGYWTGLKKPSSILGTFWKFVKVQ